MIVGVALLIEIPLIGEVNLFNLTEGYSNSGNNWTFEDLKNVAWSDESQFLLRHTDISVRIGANLMIYEPNLWCVIPVNSPGWWSWCNGVFFWHTLGCSKQNNHCLNATAYLSVFADHLHPTVATIHPSSNGHIQWDNAVMSTWNRNVTSKIYTMKRLRLFCDESEALANISILE